MDADGVGIYPRDRTVDDLPDSSFINYGGLMDPVSLRVLFPTVIRLGKEASNNKAESRICAKMIPETCTEQQYPYCGATFAAHNILETAISYSTM